MNRKRGGVATLAALTLLSVTMLMILQIVRLQHTQWSQFERQQRHRQASLVAQWAYKQWWMDESIGGKGAAPLPATWIVSVDPVEGYHAAVRCEKANDPIAEVSVVVEFPVTQDGGAFASTIVYAREY
jgi:hypothetical protein